MMDVQEGSARAEEQVSWNGLLNTAETPFEDLSPIVKFLSQHDPKLNSPTNADTAQL